MQSLIIRIVRRSVKACALLTIGFLPFHKLTKRVARLETTPVTTTPIIELLSKNTDVIFVIEPKNLIDAYRLQAEGIIKSLKNDNPDLETLEITRDELINSFPEMANRLKGDSFIIAKAKSGNNFEIFDYFTFFMKSNLISAYFQEIPKIDSLPFSKLNKFSTYIAVCEGNSKALSYLKKMSTSDAYASFSIVNFNACLKFGAGPNDLLLLKKNSQINSYNDRYLREIDGKPFDYIKIVNFFDEPTTKEQEIIESINKFSLFTPISIASNFNTKYTLMLSIDLNKTLDPERKDLEKTFKEIGLALQKSDIQLIYKTTNLKNEPFTITLFDNFKQSIQMLYKIQNKDRSTAELLEKKFPFLRQNKSETFTYLFDTKTNDFNLATFKAFFEGIRDGRVKCSYLSEPLREFKISKKLVFDNFKSIFSDDLDHFVFFYSNHCQMCKRVSRVFEESAMRHFVQKDMPDLEFNRANTTENTFYSHSPVLAYFKKGLQKPIVLNSQFFTKAIFEGFLKSVHQVALDANLTIQNA